MKKDDPRYTDHRAVVTDYRLRILYTKALSLAALGTTFINRKLIALAAELQGGLTRGRLIFLSNKGINLSFLKDMVYSATCENENVLEWFLDNNMYVFHILIYDEWLTEILKMSVKYYKLCRQYTETNDENVKGRIDDIKLFLGAKKEWYGCSAEIMKIYDEINSLRSEVIESYTPLCKAQRNAFVKGKDFPEETEFDLYQAARMGLLKALLTYNPRRNVRFGIYAKTWIRQSMFELIKSTSKTAIHLPVSTWSDYTAISNAEDAITSLKGHVEGEELLGLVEEYTGIPVKKILEVKERINVAHVLYAEDSAFDDDEDGLVRKTIMDLVVGDNPTEGDIKNVDISKLTAKQQLIVAMRFGMWDRMPRSIPEEDDLVYERIRQGVAKSILDN